jgi:hypothetical protein
MLPNIKNQKQLAIFYINDNWDITLDYFNSTQPVSTSVLADIQTIEFIDGDEFYIKFRGNNSVL